MASESAPTATGSSRRALSILQELALGAAAGLAAMAATAAADRLLDPLVSREQKRRERRIRRGSPHEVAGPRFGASLVGRPLDAREKDVARAGFSLAYGIGWGLIHALVRRSVPAASRAGGLPFAVPFFLLCDGAIAPLLGLTPTLRRVPWQLNAKELANHVVWTAGAEAAQRLGRTLVAR